MTRSKKLTEPCRCANFRDKHKCLNWVNIRKPRKLYWERGGSDEVMCWQYFCDLCHNRGVSDDFYWPTDSSGKFMESVQCSVR